MFSIQSYNIKDEKERPFIDPDEIRSILAAVPPPSAGQVEDVINEALSLKRLSMEQVAVLLNSEGPEAAKLISEAAKKIKRDIYGDRIVIFAPLYIGSKCVNNCAYCGFRSSNKDAVRRTLEQYELESEVAELERSGQKRLILVYGEHPSYSAEYIADTVRTVYGTRKDRDRINRVNINAAPFDTEGFRTIKEAGIGTYQIFQETYDPEVYDKFHSGGPKAGYGYRLTAMDRAMEAGIDDVGLGVLLGLGDWKFEVLALIRHTNHLEACFGVGPHTISFPRIQNASNLDKSLLNPVGDGDFRKLIAVLRLAVPYAGLILTAREPEGLRNELLGLGVSQIDAGTNLEIGGYSAKREKQELAREQFELTDTRTLADTVRELADRGHVPSFCTACYRKGRTGEHFMQFASTGFIKNFCTPNALLTFAEYLEDYAPEDVRGKGWELINKKAGEIPDTGYREKTERMLETIRNGGRDMLF